jgi:hypothetical protein
MSKWKRLSIIGFVGLIVPGLLVAYQIAANSAASPPQTLNRFLLIAAVLLCPPSLLSIGFIDAEIGTSGFYFVWALIALLNAALYCGVGTIFFRKRQKAN